MRIRGFFLPAFLLGAAGVLWAAQDPPSLQAPAPPEPLFVRITAYPTASLSRYDYNNDLDLYEVRVYVEVRRGSQEGAVVADAIVTSLGERLEFHADHFEKRIVVAKEARPRDLDVEIAVKGRPPLVETHPLTDWLILDEPRPAVVAAGRDLGVHWRFERFEAPVDVTAYDFRTGKEIFRRTNEPGVSVVIPASNVPADTIVRLYAIPSWLSKRYLAGPAYARGSEVIVIPWTQVFFRTRKPGPGGPL
jgi:hypothetical protein